MTERVLVWDRFVRLFHWSLVALIAGKTSSLIAPEGVYHALARNFAASPKADSGPDSV